MDKILALAHEAMEFQLEDETELPHSRLLKAHLAKGLNLAPIDVIAWVEVDQRKLPLTT